MRTFLLAAAGAMLLAAAPALFEFAAARADEADGIDCNSDMLNQSEMNICADKDYRKADAALNAAYRKATAGLDAHNRDLLRQSERAWIKFRDAECTYQAAPNEGGSIYPLIYAGCLTRLTMDRTKQLKEGQQ